MKITKKEEYKQNEYGMYDYPVGYIFEMGENKYVATISKLSCNECDFKNKRHYCNSVYCSCMRNDKKDVIFKQI